MIWAGKGEGKLAHMFSVASLTYLLAPQEGTQNLGCCPGA